MLKLQCIVVHVFVCLFVVILNQMSGFMKTFFHNIRICQVLNRVHREYLRFLMNLVLNDCRSRLGDGHISETAAGSVMLSKATKQQTDLLTRYSSVVLHLAWNKTNRSKQKAWHITRQVMQGMAGHCLWNSLRGNGKFTAPVESTVDVEWHVMKSRAACALRHIFTWRKNHLCLAPPCCMP